MAQTTTTLVIKSKTSDFEKGLNDSKSSFQQWTQSIDSLTGGFASKLTNALANPWTAVAGGVALATKSLADLTEAGMVGQDRLLKFSAMLGSQSQANSLIGTISRLSDTSFESRDAIESFAEKLVGAGHSAEDVEKILSATIDISNTSGRSFNEVGSAIENAFNGKTTQIEKMVPGLKSLGDEAWDSGDAIKYIGDELHDASVQIASGSFSNQLGAIANSWQQIKENLGTTIVTNIESTGILNTIANWLEKIEEHTRKAIDEKRLRDYVSPIIDEYALSGSVDWASLMEKGVDKGDIPAIRKYLEEHPELYTTQTESVNRILGGYTTTPDYASFFEDLIANSTESFILSNGIDVLYDYFKKNGADEFFKYRFRDLAKTSGGFQLAVTETPWYKEEVAKYTSIDEGYTKFISWLDEMEKEEPSSEKGGSGSAVDKALTSWQEDYDAFINKKSTYWSEGSLTTDLSWKERIESRDWGGTTEADWDKYLTMILSCPNDTKRQNLLKGYSDDRIAYETWKNAPTSPLSSDFGIGKNPWGEGSKPYEAITVGTRAYDWRLGGYVSEQSRKTAEILLSVAPEWDKITEEDWAELAETISMFPEGTVRTQAEEIYRQKRRAYTTYLQLQKNPSLSISRKRTTGGGGVNSLEGFKLIDGVWVSDGTMQYDPVLKSWKKSTEALKSEFYSSGKIGYREQLARGAEMAEATRGDYWTSEKLYELWSDGTITTEQAEKTAELFGLSMEEIYAKQKKDNEENTLKTIANIQNVISALNSAISSVKGWFDGKYQTGEVGSGISNISSFVSSLEPIWAGAKVAGAWGAVAGAGISLIENLASKDDEYTSYTETEMDESYKGVVHQYQGGLELHIHNDFEGANIVGESGMGELARTIQRQIELYAYDNNL